MLSLTMVTPGRSTNVSPVRWSLWSWFVVSCECVSCHEAVNSRQMTRCHGDKRHSTVLHTATFPPPHLAAVFTSSQHSFASISYRLGLLNLTHPQRQDQKFSSRGYKTYHKLILFSTTAQAVISTVMRVVVSQPTHYISSFSLDL